jgi:hypothetical protein
MPATDRVQGLYDRREITLLSSSFVWSLIIAVSAFTIPDYNSEAPAGHWMTIFNGLGIGASMLLAIPLACTILVGILLSSRSPGADVIALILAAVVTVFAVFGSIFGWPAAAIPTGVLLIAVCIHRLRSHSSKNVSC